MTEISTFNCANLKLTVEWNGPYCWPGFEADTGLPPLPRKKGGVYLQTVEYQGGYLIYLAGHAKDVRVRFSTHEKNRRTGSEISIFDMGQMKLGVRRRVWNGFSGWWKGDAKLKYLHERKEALGYPLDWGRDIPHKETRKAVAFGAHWKMILDASIQQCIDTRIFIADLDFDERLRKRLEAGIMGQLYKAASPFKDIPDQGMALSGRNPARGERPILVENKMTVLLHALPPQIEI